MDPLLEQFLQEARENLSYIDQNIEEIGGDDPELLNAVFRAAHTLKGGSGIVGFESVKEITHHAEDLLDMLRAGQIEFRDSMTEALYNAFDEVMNLIEAAEESEGIVDADEERVNEIITQLTQEMGKEDEVVVWSPPFTLLESTTCLNITMDFLENADLKLPYSLGEINEAVCEEKQLYVVVFDVDASCMVYGNDPVYTLSLLGESVLAIHTCMSSAAATSILSGLEDEEGLELKTEIKAYIYATYAEIEDALFNFADELLLLPLDIATLLGVSGGETGHQLDLLKELHSNAKQYLETGDREGLVSEIEKSLPLIGNDTIQFKQLHRFMNIVGLIKNEELTFAESFFDAIDTGDIYTFEGLDTLVDTGANTGQNDLSVPTEDVDTDAVTSEVEVPEMNAHISAGIEEILQQQKMALASCEGDDATLQRVSHILGEYIAPFVSDFPKNLDSLEAINSAIESVLSDAKNEATPINEEVVLVETPVEKTASPTEPTPTVPTVESTKPTPSANVKPKVEKEVAKKNVIGKTVKIEQESIDNLMNIVGELLVAKNSLPYLADGVHAMNSEMIKRAILEKYNFINRLSEQLQDLIMSMRMLPISYVFDRYPKLVRDISKNMGKKVKLTMEGGETRLDKNMIEMLADPMIHIMRNSLDHGIEMPDVRVQKGKSAEGNVNLRAYAQSDKIMIEIIDDGAGINVEKVIQKVLENELMSVEQIDALTDNEKAELVLLAGLSTADEISEYSGRGVGMDVVKKSIEAFGGTISIVTRPNQGTTITLGIPVSLAVTSLLHVSMSNIHYGFPMDAVAETVKIERSEIEYLHNEPFIYIRGEVIPLLFVKSMLDEDEIGDKPLSIVVLNVKDNLLAVVVNDLLGQLDVVQKPLEGLVENHPIFSGTALLGNGQIIMVIDPLGLLSIAHQLKKDIEEAS
ncbi:MAG TPA: chemotaxis protein CheA [Helicobacteraceae bacterium]|nr:chemotaxis protein CheA [Helicobacteraceae bacterium]